MGLIFSNMLKNQKPVSVSLEYFEELCFGVRFMAQRSLSCGWSHDNWIPGIAHQSDVIHIVWRCVPLLWEAVLEKNSFQCSKLLKLEKIRIPHTVFHCKLSKTFTLQNGFPPSLLRLQRLTRKITAKTAIQVY